MRQSSALVIAPHNGNEALIKHLFKYRSDFNEMGVANINHYPENKEGTARHLIANGLKDILQLLLDHGGDINQKNRTGETVISRMYVNGTRFCCP